MKKHAEKKSGARKHTQKRSQRMMRQTRSLVHMFDCCLKFYDPAANQRRM